jgi:hypothetical protein
VEEALPTGIMRQEKPLPLFYSSFLLSFTHSHSLSQEERRKEGIKKGKYASLPFYNNADDELKFARVSLE